VVVTDPRSINPGIDWHDPWKNSYCTTLVADLHGLSRLLVELDKKNTTASWLFFSFRT